jgi:hypothetical protein
MGASEQALFGIPIGSLGKAHEFSPSRDSSLDMWWWTVEHSRMNPGEIVAPTFFPWICSLLLFKSAQLNHDRQAMEEIRQAHLSGF